MVVVWEGKVRELEKADMEEPSHRATMRYREPSLRAAEHNNVPICQTSIIRGSPALVIRISSSWVMRKSSDGGAGGEGGSGGGHGRTATPRGGDVPAIITPRGGRRGH